MRQLLLVCLISFGFLTHAAPNDDSALKRLSNPGEYSYRGYKVDLTDHEAKLIEFMLGRGGLQVYDAEFARLMDWGPFTAARRTERLIAQLNHRMLLATGATVLEHVKREGRIRFEFHPRPDELTPKIFKLGEEWHEIGGAERTILEALPSEHVHQAKQNAFISEDEFRRIGLPIDHLASHLASLNQRFLKTEKDAPWIKSLTIHVMQDDYTYRYDERLNEFVNTKPDPLACGTQL